MKLSIVVPVHNMAENQKLAFCLDSLINQQNIEDYEIICVDDASTDASPAILKYYEEKYPDKIKVLFLKENVRQGGARNKGMELASGEWLGFMDSDDWADPFMYAKLVKKAEETGADVVGCDYQLVSEHSFAKGKYVQNSFEEQTGVLGVTQKQKICLGAGSMVVKIYKRNVVVEKKLSFPEKMFYEDNAMAPIWMCSFSHFEHVPEPLYYYYQHDDSTVHVVSKPKLLDRIRAGEILIEEAKKSDLYQSCKQELIYKYIQLSFCNTLFSYAQDCDENRRMKRKKEGFPASMDYQFLVQMQERIVDTLSSLQRKDDLQNLLESPEEEQDYARINSLKKDMERKKVAKKKNISYAYTCMLTNPYYSEGFDQEQKKFLEMFLVSPGRMKRYYEFLQWYRNFRYGK